MNLTKLAYFAILGAELWVYFGRENVITTRRIKRRGDWTDLLSWPVKEPGEVTVVSVTENVLELVRSLALGGKVVDMDSERIVVRLWSPADEIYLTRWDFRDDFAMALPLHRAAFTFVKGMRRLSALRGGGEPFSAMPEDFLDILGGHTHCRIHAKILELRGLLLSSDGVAKMALITGILKDPKDVDIRWGLEHLTLPDLAAVAELQGDFPNLSFEELWKATCP